MTRKKNVWNKKDNISVSAAPILIFFLKHSVHCESDKECNIKSVNLSFNCQADREPGGNNNSCLTHQSSYLNVTQTSALEPGLDPQTVL